MTSSTVTFSHELVGSLFIDNGLDDATWSYGLNTQTFPTYGGEVVQILSVYIDDLTLMGTCATYAQMEAIYKYFVAYIMTATQGQGQSANVTNNNSISGPAYNLTPIRFNYPARDWFFKIYPKSVPGFRYGLDVVTPTWQVGCFVVDDTPDADIVNTLPNIQNALAALHVTNANVPVGSESQVGPGETSELFSVNGLISPEFGDPNADPFETYDPSQQTPQAQIKQYSTYYSSLIRPWISGDLSSLEAGIGSHPNVSPSQFRSGNDPASSTVTVPGKPKAKKAGE